MTAPSVEWVEVGPRDGLQSWPANLPTPTKVGRINSLLDWGFRRAEATSLGHPNSWPKLADAGIGEIAVADRIGVANPAQVESLFQAMRERLPGVRWAAHFHDTRGAGLANLLSALETGVTLFEGSVGGIGGSPFAPGAGGNLCSEDALAMLEAIGIEVGVDVNRLVEEASGLSPTLGAKLSGQDLSTS